MDGTTYTLNKVIKLFNPELNRNTLIKAEERGDIPPARRSKTGSTNRRVWAPEDLPLIGEKYGFLQKPKNPVCASVFVTKGGVLKTTLTLNLARVAALHNIKTCIVGTDMQSDITNAFGIGTPDESEYDSLSEVDEAFDQYYTLYDFKKNDCKLSDCIQETDLPTLDIIPESSELVHLEGILQSIRSREYWLKEKVITPLLEEYDLVLIDSPPSWNNLVTNALTASDVLISPLECKINHYRNVPSFMSFIEDFQVEVKADFRHICIPTKLVSKRKLAADIRKYYMQEVKNCTATAIKETTAGEESMAQHVSLLEYVPGKAQADEMKDAIVEIWRQISEVASMKSVSKGKSTVRSKGRALEASL